MPLRVARYQELCRRCDKRTESHCFRCKSPLCLEHLPDPSKRCPQCEHEFQRWPSREPSVLAFGSLMILAWAALTLVLIDVSPAAAGLWALLYPLAVGFAAQRELKCGRQLFLNQETRPTVVADPRRLLHGQTAAPGRRATSH